MCALETMKDFKNILVDITIAMMIVILFHIFVLEAEPNKVCIDINWTKGQTFTSMSKNLKEKGKKSDDNTMIKCYYLFAGQAKMLE